MIAKKLFLFVLFLLICFLFILGVFWRHCTTQHFAHGVATNDPLIDAAHIDQSYLLLTPIAPSSSQPSENATESGQIYLTNLLGQPLHTWKVHHRPFYAVLDPAGNLIVLSAYVFPGDDGLGQIQKLDWNGNVIWEYDNGLLHHDFTLNGDGNIFAIVAEAVPDQLIPKVQGGNPNVPAAGIPPVGKMISDALIEIDHQGKVIWTWHEYEHLDTSIDQIGPNDSRGEWAHTNSVQYLRQNPINGEEGFLISLRQISTVMIIQKKDGAILWRSPAGMLDHQHDATVLSNDNILVFNNRVHSESSEVAEINPKTNQVVWNFINGKTILQQNEFFSLYLGGAQRLENGNTMISDSLHGHLFEITPDKKLVWDFVNPFGAPAGLESSLWPTNTIYKARRYNNNQVQWPGKLPQPIPSTAIQCKL